MTDQNLKCELNKLFEKSCLFQALVSKYIKIKCLETSTCSNMTKLEQLKKEM